MSNRKPIIPAKELARCEKHDELKSPAALPAFLSQHFLQADAPLLVDGSLGMPEPCGDTKTGPLG